MTSVREAILAAAENVGNRLNKNGLTGFMEWLASENPRVFVRLLERAMRDQPEKSEDAPPPTPRSRPVRLDGQGRGASASIGTSTGGRKGGPRADTPARLGHDFPISA